MPRSETGAEARRSASSDLDFAASLRADRARLLFGIGVEAREAPWRPGRGRRLAGAVAEAVEETALACSRRAGPFPAGAFLVATGGLGRRELAPHSDLDLLVAFSSPPEAASKDWAAAFMRLLWDCGLKGNLGVRTLRECRADADEDFDFLTALAAGRRLLGEVEAWDAFLSELRKKKGASALKRILADDEALADSLFGKAWTMEASPNPKRGAALEVYARDPDIKEGFGSLRSLHRMEWLGFFASPDGNRNDWKSRLPPREVRRTEAAYDLELWLRIRLHDRKGREMDLLGHDDLEAIGRESGVVASGARGGAYEAASLGSLLVAARRQLAWSEFALRSAYRSLVVRRGVPRPRLAEPKASPPTAHPTGMFLDDFLPIGRGETGIDASLIRRWREDSGARASPTRPSITDRPSFESLRSLLSSPWAGKAFAALDAASLLGAFLPPWGAARDLWPTASFHDRPLGIHSIRSISVADLLLGPDREEARRFSPPLAAIAGRYLETSWIAKLALLLHDLGKLFPGDHAKNGAALAEEFLAPLPTETLIKDMIVSLVEDHLLLSSASRRIDAGAESVLEELAAEFASRSYPEDNFGLLAIITACDMAATNPEAFTGYRKRRFEELVAALDVRLASGEGRSAREKLLAAKLGELDELCADAAEDSCKDLRAFALSLGERYLLTTPAVRIGRDRELWRANGHERIDLEVGAENDHLRVRIIAPDEKGLFASLSGILLANGADIVSADIHTLEGVAIDEFRVTEVFGNDLLAAAMARELSLWVAELDRSLRHYLLHPNELALHVYGLERASRKPPAIFRAPARVEWTREGEGLRFDISCGDRPALLYDLAHRLSVAGFDTKAACIETHGFRVHDSFHVSTPPRPAAIGGNAVGGNAIGGEADGLDTEALDAFAAELARTCEGQTIWPNI
ncbi:MAG: HD domain-containing protein [Treponema sp.]|nr:HD domain-containing protein [Treponema sp.]